MSYAGSLHRHAGQVGIVAPPASSTGVTPSNVLTDAISAAIGLQPLTVAQATQALMQCPNVFDAVYKLDPVQFNRALQNWSAGSMGPITATNLCTKLDQLRQDLNQLQAPAPPVSTPPSNAEATGQKRGYKSVLLLGGLVVAMSGFAWWSSMHAHGARRNPERRGRQEHALHEVAKAMRQVRRTRRNTPARWKAANLLEASIEKARRAGATDAEINEAGYNA